MDTCLRYNVWVLPKSQLDHHSQQLPSEETPPQLRLPSRDHLGHNLLTGLDNLSGGVCRENPPNPTAQLYVQIKTCEIRNDAPIRVGRHYDEINVP